MQYGDHQKLLETYLGNIPYAFKPAMFEHLSRFIRDNEYFWVRSNVEKTPNNQFFCFIELVGYVHIGKIMIEIRIMLPHNYPAAPPQFDLVYNSASFRIANQGSLVASQTIYIRKNEAQEELIRLNFESIRRVWQGGKHICQAFKQICKEINNPPLLQSVAYENPSSKSFIDFKVARHKSSDMSQRIIQEFQLQICLLQQNQAKVESAKREVDYRQARADFIMRNAAKLQKSIKTQQNKVNKQLQELRFSHEKMLLDHTVDPLLEISEEQRASIAAVARRDALKDAEKKVNHSIQRNLTEVTAGGFEQHKNVIKQLYQEMFQNQLQYLRLCD